MNEHENTVSFFLSIYCFLIGNTPIVNAQTGKFYSTDKELSNSLINAVYQDRKGFIWIATENGLNKFDGARFSIYRHITADSSSLKTTMCEHYSKTAVVISGSDALTDCNNMTEPLTVFMNYLFPAKTDERIPISPLSLNAGTEISG